MKGLLIAICVITLTVSCVVVSYAVCSQNATEKTTNDEIVAQSIDEIKSSYNLNDEIEKKQCVSDIFNYMGISEKQSDIILRHSTKEIIDGFAYAESYGYVSKNFTASHE